LVVQADCASAGEPMSSAARPPINAREYLNRLVAGILADILADIFSSSRSRPRAIAAFGGISQPIHFTILNTQRIDGRYPQSLNKSKRN
jgi:hypothetical protein